MQSIDISSTYHDILSQIRTAEATYGRLPNSVQLLAVSKKQPIEKIRQLADCGHHAFGESYVQEAIEKINQLSDRSLTWHFIGPIQSNKTKLIAEHFSWVHSVDRLKIAQRLNQQRPESLPRLNICIQVNVSLEPTKSGFLPDELLPAVEKIRQLPHLVIRGLMVIPAPAEQFVVQRQQFKHAHDLLKQLQTIVPDADTLSMGMSADLEAAIAEHSTCVRIGTALFGHR
ncbi:MAG: YggS family pyridoxal phosphate-dependent enzyme [Methylococcales bacterium]|jgi:PLP dependent protein|nr:YggS family pyridoxal phosphate-dependent enzyme [Methylococcales bacterium]MBT7444599.1 YggS family pyridoxal phosphate-dependent enzyme [Methylococcales bacterium]